jgi:hypothetical protein
MSFKPTEEAVANHHAVAVAADILIETVKKHVPNYDKGYGSPIRLVNKAMESIMHRLYTTMDFSSPEEY